MWAVWSAVLLRTVLLAPGGGLNMIAEKSSRDVCGGKNQLFRFCDEKRIQKECSPKIPNLVLRYPNRVVVLSLLFSLANFCKNVPRKWSLKFGKHSFYSKTDLATQRRGSECDFWSTNNKYISSSHHQKFLRIVHSGSFKFYPHRFPSDVSSCHHGRRRHRSRRHQYGPDDGGRLW